MPKLDNRHRDKDGRISQKRADTRVDTIRKSDRGFAPGRRGDLRLGRLRDGTGRSLTQMRKSGAESRKPK